MKKSFIALALLMGIGMMNVATAYYYPYYGGYYGPYWGYPYYDEGAVIASNVIGGVGGLMGAAIASSEARKARNQEARIARLEAELQQEKMKNK